MLEKEADMTFSVSVGESDFEDLRRAGSYYVDKTEILYELIQNTKNKVTLFTRPRRFGKTLMMSMISNFFSIKKDSRKIFEGLNITAHKEFCEKWMNQYPVLFLSFKDVEADNFEDAFGKLCIEYADLKSNSEVNQNDVRTFGRLETQKGTPYDIKNSLKTIMRMLHAVYGKKVILLLDEYDVPLARASEKDTAANKYYSSILGMMRGIMSTTLKDNEFLEFAVITGCLRIANRLETVQESIFTGTNNFASYSVLDDKFSQYFGFVQEEINDLLQAADLVEAAGPIKEWYDGYLFGGSSLYCPWDVINHISALRYKRTARPKNYWKNTSHNGILLTFVERTDFDVTEKFETLLNGGTITQSISDELTYDTLHASEENLWSVLLMTGYLTKADPEEDGETVSLKIPNREIASIFEDTVVAYFKKTADTTKLDSLIKSLWEGDDTEATRQISDLLWDTISYHEDYYHAFLAGIFVGRGYGVEFNKEKGLGRTPLDDSGRCKKTGGWTV